MASFVFKSLVCSLDLREESVDGEPDSCCGNDVFLCVDVLQKCRRMSADTTLWQAKTANTKYEMDCVATHSQKQRHDFGTLSHNDEQF